MWCDRKKKWFWNQIHLKAMNIGYVLWDRLLFSEPWFFMCNNEIGLVILKDYGKVGNLNMALKKNWGCHYYYKLTFKI